MSDRYEKGLKKMLEFTDQTNKDSATHLKIEDKLKEIAPDISKFMIEFTYGDVYTRAGLDNKQRALVTISSLVTQGTLPQLELHINAALTAGLKPEEIIETFVHLLSYTGFPKVLNAVEVAQKVFLERNVTLPTTYLEQ